MADPKKIDFEPIDFEPEPPQRSLMGRGWDAISSPLWEGPSRGARALSGFMKDSGEQMESQGPLGRMEGDDSWTDSFRKLAAQGRGFAEGGVEGIGDLLSGFTSPIDLAAMLASGGSSIAGKAGFQGAARGLSAASRAASVPVAVHGAAGVLDPSSTLSERGRGLLELAGGVAGASHSPTPRGSVNPSLAAEIVESPTPTPRPAPVRPTGPRPSNPMNPMYQDIPENMGAFGNNKRPADVALRKAQLEDDFESGMDINEPIDLNSIKPDMTTISPRGPGYTRDVLGMADIGGEPGFGVQPHGDDFFFTYRGPDGSPVSVAKVTKNAAGERMVSDFATDKSKGLLSGKAAVTIGKELQRRGVTKSSSGLTPDSVNFMDRMLKTRSGGGETPVNPKGSSATPILGSEERGSTVKIPRTTAANMAETPAQMKARLAAEGKPTPILEEEVGISRPTPKQARLQADLAGARPRFNIGADSYTPQFESDIDKALFIIAQMNPSKRDADYLNFAMRQLGINEGQARQLGSKLRTEIKGIVKQVGGGGDIEIPTLHQDLIKGGKTPELSDPVPGMGNVPPAPPKPPNRGNGGGGIPPEEPEMHVTGDEHIGDTMNAKRSAIVEAFNLPRGLMASYDFSAPLRQGLGLIHKKEFWKALRPMMKSWASEDSFQASQKAIADRPLFRPRIGPGGKQLKSFAEDAGLKLGDLTDLSKREEAIMSTWAETGGDVIPGYKQTVGRGVRASNRAYTAFLNNLRADTFDSLVNTSKVFGADARADLPLARALADFVNTASGRGSLGSLENSAVALNTALFSPRLIASRIQMMNPQNYLMGPPAVRKEYLKSLFAIAAAGNTVTQLGKMAGGTVESDPASSDFGKLKIGNTRVDPWGGFQQYGVLINRLLTGNYKSSTSGKMTDLSNPKGPYDQTKLGVLGRFAWGKTHPVVNFAIALANGGKELSGEKMDFTTMDPMKNALVQRFIPIIMQDMYELSQEEPELLPIMIPAAFGMGTQTYGAKQ